MIVALVLSMLLLAATTQLTRRVLRANFTVARLTDRNTSAEGLANQIERDLLAARSISTWPDGLILRGPLGFDSTTGEFHGQDVSVVYHIVALPTLPGNANRAISTWLCRDQFSGDFRVPQREMLWPRVATWTVSTNELGALESVDAPEIVYGVPSEVSDKTTRVPTSVDVLVAETSGEVILQRRFHHHEE
ncbi:MAG: hypothetical protein AAGD07_02280 [Planctomycetota bacterium]